MRVYQPTQIILNAKATTGIGSAIDVSGFRHAIISVATASSANLTVKFKGSIEEDLTALDFSAAQSVSNMWDYVQVVDANDGSVVNGSTGVVPSGTDVFHIYEVAIDGLKYLNAHVTARAAGSVTVKVRLFNDV
jgi:hypothetical protein